MMDFRFNGLGFFISDILSPFVRLFKLDIHHFLYGYIRDRENRSRGALPVVFHDSTVSR